MRRHDFFQGENRKRGTQTAGQVDLHRLPSTETNLSSPPLFGKSRGDGAVPGALPHPDGAAGMWNYVGCFQREVRACFLSFANCMIAKEALWF